MAISKQIVLLRDYEEEAKLLQSTYGRTSLFSTGVEGLDKYLGGGFGREHGYEIVLLFGATGIGKSLVGLNFVKSAIAQGKRIALLTLEDDGADVFIRLTDILGGDATDEYVRKGEYIWMLPRDATMKPWKLDDLIDHMESLYRLENIDLILLDHIQFAFENAETIRGENEYIQQRVFMQKLNHLMKRVKKTIILISHVNKDTHSKGLYKIVGSSGIAQAATKALEVYKEDNSYYIKMWKSRFTKTPDHAYQIILNGTVLEDGNVTSIFPRND